MSDSADLERLCRIACNSARLDAVKQIIAMTEDGQGNVDELRRMLLARPTSKSLFANLLGSTGDTIINQSDR